MIPSNAILLVHCFQKAFWVFSKVDESIFHPIGDSGNKRLGKAETCVGVFHFSSECFNQITLPRGSTRMPTLDQMFWCFYIFAQGTLICGMHTKKTKLKKYWKNVVADFR